MRPDQLQTNRDLYLFVAELVQAKVNAPIVRDLEQYLSAIWLLGSAHKTAVALPLGYFAAILIGAFGGQVPEGDLPVPRDPARSLAQDAGYLRWERTVMMQMVDLREMREGGALRDELRYFGVDGPSGARWYNFDPCTYLECAVAGTFGGWQPGDQTGRSYVPGKVAVLDVQGRIASAEPREIDEPINDIASVSWHRFADFLEAGQSYE
ncbi:MAG: hypothetical protein HY901_37135 [Deltaproteobacteria bacterium]|nr:hypothetical protein [Deltaproteobacteria bacterium]